MQIDTEWILVNRQTMEDLYKVLQKYDKPTDSSNQDYNIESSIKKICVSILDTIVEQSKPVIL
jgi:hypothetical protein